MIVLGGSLSHQGGLEAFCHRAEAAIDRHAGGWRATWWSTDTAYLAPRRLPAALRAWRRLARADGLAVDLVWLQWSTASDLLFLWWAKAHGLPVMVTPHLGANSRLQRVPALRALCLRLLARADRLALLFAEQGREIALPPAVPRTLVGTFLPELTLTAFPASRRDGPLRLIHAGRLSHGKGTFRMIELCATLRDRGVAFDARIVGRADAATRGQLVRAIAHADLGGSLALVDWLDEAALIAALGEADVLIHLSRLDSFPLIVLEALAAGTVPIVADMAGARAMVAAYAGFVVTGDTIEAAADWLAAQDAAELRRRATEIAERVRREQAWESAVARLMSAAEATCAARAP